MTVIILVYFIATFFSLSLLAQDPVVPQDHCFSFSRHDDATMEIQNYAHLPPSVRIRTIHFATPSLINPTEKAEISTLLNGTFEKDQLSHVVDILKRRNIFDRITLKLSTVSSNEFDITIETLLFSMVSDVAIHGFLLGKERLIALYGLRIGDQFTTAKHSQGMQRIREWFEDQGYYSASIVDSLIFDNEQRVVVDIAIKTHAQYSIAPLQVSISGDLLVEHRSQLKQKLEKMVRKKLHRTYFSKHRLDEQIESLTGCLRNLGYVYVQIHCQRNPNSITKKIGLDIDVSIHQKKRFELIGCSDNHRKLLISAIGSFNAIATIVPLDILAEEMLRWYKSWGFRNTKISYVEEPDVIYFTIDEGNPIHYQIIQATYSDLDQTTKEALSAMISNKVIAFDQYKLLKTHIIEYLRNNGYWDARIVVESEIPANEKIDLTIKIVSGAQRNFKFLSFTHFQELAKNRNFTDFNNLKEPVPLAVDMLKEQLKNIETYLQERGLLYAKAKPVLIPEENSYCLEWQFDGLLEPVKFGNVYVEGRQSGIENCLMQKLQFKLGQLWDPALLYGSYKRLMELDIFDDVSIQPINLANPEITKDCSIKYTLAKPFEARLRAGLLLVGQNLEYSTVTMKMGGNFHWRNISNRADHLTINADYSRYKRDVVLRYYQPWFMDWPIQHSYEVYSTRYSQALVPGSKFNLYDLYQNGLLGELKIMQDDWNVGWNIGFETMQLECISYALAQKINFEPQLVGKHIPYIFSEGTLFGQNLDNSINPHNGYYGLLTAKMMYPFGLKNGAFLRLLAEGAFFMPLGYCTLALRARMGHIFYQAFPRIMPSERFYLGGAFSLRGYMTDLVPPVNYVENMGCVFPVPVGGKSMINTNIELRIPLSTILSGAIFTDIGLLSPTAWYQMQISDIHAGSGIGLRFETPVGPLRFDIARKWKADVYGQGLWRWYITLGYPF